MSASVITASEFAALPTRLQLSRVEHLVRQAIPLYGLPVDSEVKMLNYSENATYLIIPPSGPRRVLRINRPGYHPRENILSELLWVQSIQRDTPITTADPVPALDGSLVQYVWHPKVPEPRHCVLMSFVEGTEPDETNRLAAFELLGEVTARLHLHSSKWKSEYTITRHRWDFDAMLGNHPLWGRWQDGLGMTPAIKRQLTRLVETLKPRINRIGFARNRFGLIHADLRAANLLVQKDRVAVIDFDDCGFSWFIYDLASALSFIETHPDVPAYVEAWLKGYRTVRQLSKAEINEIESFIMLRRMLLVAWIGSHADTAQAQAMGPQFTVETCDLANSYLTKFA